MKFLRRPTRLLTAVTAAAAAFAVAAPTVAAQTPTAPPAGASAANRQTTAAAANSAGANAVSRERRAQAYAKLLEGQRYLVGGNLTDVTLRLAQQALQQAVTLDPALSEAYVGLADISFFYRSDFDEAERQAAAGIRVNKNSFGAHRVLSRVLTFKSGLRENNLDKVGAERAVAALREVVRLSPSDAEGWALLGDFYFALGRNQEAIEAFKSWESSPVPINGQVYQLIAQRELTPEAAAARLGEALLRGGRTAEAFEAVRRAVERDSDNDVYLSQFYDIVLGGGVDDQVALVELRRLATVSPENAMAQRVLASVQARAGQTDAAIETLRQAIARRAGGQAAAVELRKDLAQTLSDAMRYGEAISAYEELLKSYGEAAGTAAAAAPPAAPPAEQSKQEAAEVLASVIKLQKQAGRPNDALATIERMRRLLGADDPTADVQYVEWLRDQSKRSEALQASRAALIKFPEQRALLWYQAATLTDLGRVDEAVGLLRGKLKNGPEDVFTYIQISSLYSQAGRGAESVEAARKAVDQSAQGNQRLQTRALFALSSAQERAGDLKGSEAGLRSILTKDPNNAEALNNLGYFMIERNDRLEEALKFVQRAVRAEPFNPSYLDSLGWAYYKLNKFEEAERYLSDAARRDSGSATIQEHLGDVYQKRGKAEQARTAWQKALSLSVEAAEVDRLRAKLGTEKR